MGRCANNLSHTRKQPCFMESTVCEGSTNYRKRVVMLVLHLGTITLSKEEWCVRSNIDSLVLSSDESYCAKLPMQVSRIHHGQYNERM